VEALFQYIFSLVHSLLTTSFESVHTVWNTLRSSLANAPPWVRFSRTRLAIRFRLPLNWIEPAQGQGRCS
jgi:hypothetical protein